MDQSWRADLKDITQKHLFQDFYLMAPNSCKASTRSASVTPSTSPRTCTTTEGRVLCGSSYPCYRQSGDTDHLCELHKHLQCLCMITTVDFNSNNQDTIIAKLSVFHLWKQTRVGGNKCEFQLNITKMKCVFYSTTLHQYCLIKLPNTHWAKLVAAPPGH